MDFENMSFDDMGIDFNFDDSCDIPFDDLDLDLNFDDEKKVKAEDSIEDTAQTKEEVKEEEEEVEVEVEIEIELPKDDIKEVLKDEIEMKEEKPVIKKEEKEKPKQKKEKQTKTKAKKEESKEQPTESDVDNYISKTKEVDMNSKVKANDIELPDNMIVKIYGSELFKTRDGLNTIDKIRNEIVNLGYTEFRDEKTSGLVIKDKFIVDNIVFHDKG